MALALQSLPHKFLFNVRAAVNGWHDQADIDIKDDIDRGLAEDGYAIVNDFLSPGEVKNFKDAMDQAYLDHPSDVRTFSKGSDQRIFGIEKLSPAFDKFAHNDWVEQKLTKYVGKDIELAFTLAGKIKATSENTGSGDGWHRDSFQVQVKSFLFLDDVTMKNGPFQIIPRTANQDKIRDMMSVSSARAFQHRFPHEQVMHYCQARDTQPVSVVCKAGTLVLADTRGLHRGLPLETGSRNALTNYYFIKGRELESKLNYFKPNLVSVA